MSEATEKRDRESNPHWRIARLEEEVERLEAERGDAIREAQAWYSLQTDTTVALEAALKGSAEDETAEVIEGYRRLATSGASRRAITERGSSMSSITDTAAQHDAALVQARDTINVLRASVAAAIARAQAERERAETAEAKLAIANAAIDEWRTRALEVEAAQAAVPPVADPEDDPYHALAFAHGAIQDAIGLEDGLDGADGEAVLSIIDRALAAAGRAPCVYKPCYE